MLGAAAKAAMRAAPAAAAGPPSSRGRHVGALLAVLYLIQAACGLCGFFLSWCPWKFCLLMAAVEGCRVTRFMIIKQNAQSGAEKGTTRLTLAKRLHLLVLCFPPFRLLHLRLLLLSRSSGSSLTNGRMLT